MSVLPLRRPAAASPDPADITLDGHDAEYDRLRGLQITLQARLVELGKAEAALVRQIKAAEAPITSKPGLRPRVAALLGKPAGEGAVEGLDDKLLQVEAEIRDIRAAVAEIEPALFQAHSRASYAACQQLKPRHDALVSAMADAMRAVGKAQDDLAAFYRDLDAANIQRGSLATQLIPSQACGGMNEWVMDRMRQQDFVSRWFQHARRSGYKVKE